MDLATSKRLELQPARGHLLKSSAGAISCILLAALAVMAGTYSFDFSISNGSGSPYIWGSGNPAGVSYDLMNQVGIRFLRAEVKGEILFPRTTLAQYKADMAKGNFGVADPSTWNWSSGIYGNFIEQAYAKKMATCLILRNAPFNTGDGSYPDSPRGAARKLPVDTDVWVDITRKIIAHFNSRSVHKVQWLEVFNEPELEMTSSFSGMTKQNSLAELIPITMKARDASADPSVKIGGSGVYTKFASTTTGEVSDWVAAVLKHPVARGCDFISFHRYSTNDPSSVAPLYRAYERNLGLSPKELLITEWGPSMSNAQSNAQMYCKSVNFGVTAVGWWEMQPAGGADDPYYFTGSGPYGIVTGAGAIPLMSVSAGLGNGRFTVRGTSSTNDAMAATNSIGKQIIVLASAGSHTVSVRNSGTSGAVHVAIYRTGGSAKAMDVSQAINATATSGSFTFNVNVGTGEAVAAVFGSEMPTEVAQDVTLRNAGDHAHCHSLSVARRYKGPSSGVVVSRAAQYFDIRGRAVPGSLIETRIRPSDLIRRK